MIKTAGACPLFTNISATRHKYRGGEIQIQIFCGLIPQIKLVNHGSTGEERTPATRVITNTATHRTPDINVTVQYTGADMIALNITKHYSIVHLLMTRYSSHNPTLESH